MLTDIEREAELLLIPLGPWDHRIPPLHIKLHKTPTALPTGWGGSDPPPRPVGLAGLWNQSSQQIKLSTQLNLCLWAREKSCLRCGHRPRAQQRGNVSLYLLCSPKTRGFLLLTLFWSILRPFGRFWAHFRPFSALFEHYKCKSEPNLTEKGPLGPFSGQIWLSRYP